MAQAAFDAADEASAAETVESATESLPAFDELGLSDEMLRAIENLGYSRTRAVLGNSGLPCTLVDIDRDGLSVSALEASGASLCYLTPSHQFPTGVTLPATRRAQQLAWAAERPGR